MFEAWIEQVLIDTFHRGWDSLLGWLHGHYHWRYGGGDAIASTVCSPSAWRQTSPGLDPGALKLPIVARIGPFISPDFCKLLTYRATTQTWRQ